MLILPLAALSFFEGIAHFFKTVFNLISDTLSDLIYIIESIGSTAANIPSWLIWLPGQVVTIFLGGVSLIIIYKILGRD